MTTVLLASWVIRPGGSTKHQTPTTERREEIKQGGLGEACASSPKPYMDILHIAIAHQGVVIKEGAA